MQYKIQEREFKALGFTFQKLYANNHKSYRKNFGEYEGNTLWCWVKGKEIELDGFFRNTEKVIQFFKENRTNPDIVSESKMFPGTVFFKFLFNRQTADIISEKKARETWFSLDESIPAVDRYSKFLSDRIAAGYEEKVYTVDIIDQILQTVELLTKGDQSATL